MNNFKSFSLSLILFSILLFFLTPGLQAQSNIHELKEAVSNIYRPEEDSSNTYSLSDYYLRIHNGPLYENNLYPETYLKKKDLIIVKDSTDRVRSVIYFTDEKRKKRTLK